MKLAKFKFLCGLVKCHLLLVAEDILNRRICAVEVDQENSIVEHMEKEHKLQKVHLSVSIFHSMKCFFLRMLRRRSTPSFTPGNITKRGWLST